MDWHCITVSTSGVTHRHSHCPIICQGTVKTPNTARTSALNESRGVSCGYRGCHRHVAVGAFRMSNLQILQLYSAPAIKHYQIQSPCKSPRSMEYLDKVSRHHMEKNTTKYCMAPDPTQKSQHRERERERSPLPRPSGNHLHQLFYRGHSLDKSEKQFSSIFCAFSTCIVAAMWQQSTYCIRKCINIM